MHQRLPHVVTDTFETAECSLVHRKRLGESVQIVQLACEVQLHFCREPGPHSIVQHIQRDVKMIHRLSVGVMRGSMRTSLDGILNGALNVATEKEVAGEISRCGAR